jgi:hypothetical protein
MRRFVSPLRIALALVAAANSVAAPLVAHAHHLAPGRAGFTEVCTDAGIKRLPPAPGDGSPTSAERSHCSACVVSTVAQAPGPAPAADLVRVAGGPKFPALRSASLPVERIRAAQPRGPPEFDRSA